MLKYEGSFEVNKRPEEVFELLTNPHEFARALPGFRDVKVSENGLFTINLTLNMWPLRGDVTIEGSFVEVKEHLQTKVIGKGVGIGSTLNFTLEFKITRLNSGSRVNWAFEGIVGGLAASVGERVLNAIARNLIDKIINNIVKALAERAQNRHSHDRAQLNP